MFCKCQIKPYLCIAFETKDFGRLAQLVQSICLTSRGSGVRIPQRPHLRNSVFCSDNKAIGRLAQLVQSICLTSRGSGVRIPQRPRKSSIARLFLFSAPPFFPGGGVSSKISVHECKTFLFSRSLLFLINMFYRMHGAQGRRQSGRKAGSRGACEPGHPLPGYLRCRQATGGVRPSGDEHIGRLL